ncbi:MAG TPA: response regulator [Bacteroidia bacterium]|nr:response regulator [Bacteroidia bacterium]
MKTEKLTIFVVDDSSLALDAITKALQQNIHCTVRGFTSAEDCMHRMEDGLPDLILSDYNLDGLSEHKMNGDRMLARIKMKYPSIPVVMYSSDNSIDVVLKLMRLGAIDFIPKEKNFVQTISDITLKQINQIKLNLEQKVLLRNLVLFMGVAITIWTIIGIYTPDLLVYYLFGLIAWIFFWMTFIANRKEETTKETGNLHKISHS